MMMAISSSHRLFPSSSTSDGHKPFSRGTSLNLPRSSSSFDPRTTQVTVRRGQSLRIFASGSTPGRRQVEVVYDPDERLNRLADAVDDNAGLSRLSLFSPCKINVFLRITGKRADGFHDLASLFHVISLGDTIKFSLSPTKTKDRLSANVPGVPVDERNLIIKALNLYRKKTGTDNYFWIHLDKKVPTGAGLGGGSSNAATALWAANQFSGGLATEKELQEWSGEIGSDVPFFFSQGAAYCTGRGEVVEDIPRALPMDLPMVLIKPPEACSTAEIYSNDIEWELSSHACFLTREENHTLLRMNQKRLLNRSEVHVAELVPKCNKIKLYILSVVRSDYIYIYPVNTSGTIKGLPSPDFSLVVYDLVYYFDCWLATIIHLTNSRGIEVMDVKIPTGSSTISMHPPSHPPPSLPPSPPPPSTSLP
ncbi:hypothetical protein ZIOFF_041305 [Zingiber officinale]|uniref:GHMP kinase N-terminal domain-containing protein n=1 Tax=Zingiber officinale TaxID=94328 RepID=A0A8J5G4S7_ZINOF|nr:hypothetical protein ZIOFF_041305 [Zingiber officinale]